MPKIHRPLAIAAGLALAAGGLGTGVAFAATGSNAPTKPAVVSTVVTKAPAAVAAPAAPAKAKPAAPTDADNVQEGDQTTPDTGSEAAEAPGTEAPETGTETESPSDGPGGHEDPAGNVDHQFEGTE
ncbi:MAG: hypothetical protein QOG53_1321 [Frankiales bacterium]|jgi:hypothetical protein|nr:hypothetical protein [Frankiales bacterium]